MKIKSFNENMNSSEIDAICKEYKIENYTINEDGSIDVDGHVKLSFRKLTKIPLKFRNIHGNFWCNNNQLTSLENCPIYVDGWFGCRNNQLTSLKHAPQHVTDVFYCNNNQLTSLEYGPTNVGSEYICNDNKLISLKGIPKRVSILKCSNNIIKDLNYLPYYKEIEIGNNPIDKIFQLLENDKELIYEFKDRDIIEGDVVIVERFLEFVEDMKLNRSFTKSYITNLLQKEYTIR